MKQRNPPYSGMRHAYGPMESEWDWKNKAREESGEKGKER